MEPISLAVPGVQGLQPYEPGKPVDELERQYGVSNVIKLASNENPLGPSPRALQVIREASQTIGRYPDGNGFHLKDALAKALAVKTDQLTLGNGSNDVLEFVARAFVNPGDEVIFSQHAFAIYPIVTQAVGGKAVVVPARSWGHDLGAMSQAITDKTRLIFIANPNNPTGTWLTARQLEGFIKSVADTIIVVIDEAYHEYVQQSEYPDCINWLDSYPNLVVTRTFSKAYGLAGLRIGYGVSSSAIADILNRLRQPFNVNSLALAAAQAALADRAHLEKSIETNTRGMGQLVAAFEDAGFDYVPSVANFVAVDTGRLAGPIYESLLQKGIIVRPVGNYDMPNHLRISIGTTDENQRFIEAFRQVMG